MVGPLSEAMLMVIGTTGTDADGEGEADAEAVGLDGFVPHAARSAATSTTLRAEAVRFMDGDLSSGCAAIAATSIYLKVRGAYPKARRTSVLGD